VTNDRAQREVARAAKKLEEKWKIEFTTRSDRGILPAVRSHPGLATKELMAEFRRGRQDAIHPIEQTVFLVPGHVVHEVAGLAKCLVGDQAEGVMRVPRVVRPPRDKAWFVPV
jgi:hypothetical protein